MTLQQQSNYKNKQKEKTKMTKQKLQKAVKDFYDSPRTFKRSIKDEINTFNSSNNPDIQAKAQDKVLDHAITKAWGEAMQSERFKGKAGSTILQNKEELIKTLKDAIKNPVYGDFDSWHDTMCQNTDYGTRYGVWQKFINILFKYLYCANVMTNGKMFSEFNSIWSKCYCPVDSVIAKKLYVLMSKHNFTDEEKELVKSISKNGAINWNNIDRDNYRLFQDIVARCCQYEGIDISKLEFDFLYWDSSILHINN